MSTQELKLDLINWLTKLNDKQLLQSLSSIKDSIERGDWYKHLSSFQKKSLAKGIEDFKKGNFVTSKEFWSRRAKKA